MARVRRKRRVGGWHIAVQAACGTVLLCVGLALAVVEGRDRLAYATLARGVVLVEPDACDDMSPAPSESPAPDWEALSAANPDLAAWVVVDETDISLPVLAPSDGDGDYYLRHDLWGSWSVAGTPFLDSRSDAQGPHRLVYGHHLTTGGQFSELQHAYEQEAFDALGDCHWLTLEGSAVRLAPLCALRVDAWFEAIQRFSFAGPKDLRDWLAGLCEQADARVASWPQACARARSVATLVTCSSELPFQSERTLVLFAEAVPATGGGEDACGAREASGG